MRVHDVISSLTFYVEPDAVCVYLEGDVDLEELTDEELEEICKYIDETAAELASDEFWSNVDAKLEAAVDKAIARATIEPEWDGTEESAILEEEIMFGHIEDVEPYLPKPQYKTVTINGVEAIPLDISIWTLATDEIFSPRYPYGLVHIQVILDDELEKLIDKCGDVYAFTASFDKVREYVESEGYIVDEDNNIYIPVDMLED